MESDQQLITHRVKIVVIGGYSVGKSSLIRRFNDGTFSFDIRLTLGLSDIRKIIRINDKYISINLWDTAGQEKYRDVNKLYYRQANGAAIIFDITNRESFNNLKMWLKDVSDSTGPNLKTILVGNKIDLAERRVISINEGQDFAKKHKMEYLETSAKDGTDVDKLFFVLTEKILEDEAALYSSSNGSDALSLQPHPKHKAKMCC